MKRIIFISIMLLFAVIGAFAGETAYYVFVMFYGNDSEPLLTTIQVDESFKARLEKRNIKFDWSETPVPRDYLILEGKGIRAECDLTEYNETWCVTDSSQRIIGISDIFPVGREISWFRVSEYNGDFTVETPGRNITIGLYDSIENEHVSEELDLMEGERFIFNNDDKISKIDSSGVQFIIIRK